MLFFDSITAPQILFYIFLAVVGASVLYLLLQLVRQWRSNESTQDLSFDPPSHVERQPQHPIRILFLAANPHDIQPLRLAEEIRAIDQVLRLAEFREHFELEQQWAVRVDDLQGHLLRYQPDIVHFSGHGSQASEIILEDEHGESQIVPTQALSRLFAILQENIRCVVLNACYSQAQALAIAQSIDCVVGMSDALTDEAARSFAAAFYQALAYGCNVRTAFDLGVSQISLENLSDEEIPQLLALRVKPEEIVFVKHDSR